MYLIYTDETGKSFGKNKLGLYSDGMFFIYGGLSISFNNYELVENAFKDLCKDILKINNIYKTEIHAGNIFKKNKNFEKVNSDSIYIFFNEILQMVAKFNINLIFGIVYKNATIFGDISKSENKLKLVSSAIYSFFNILDYFLSSNESKGIIIADEITEIRYKNINYLLKNENLLGKKGKEPKIDLVMNRIFFEKLNRFKEENIEPILNFKYTFESKIYSILDNIHFVKSNLSPLTQLTDVLLFLINLYLENSYISKMDKKNKIFENELYNSKNKLVDNIRDSIVHYLINRNAFGYVYKDNSHQLFDILQDRLVKPIPFIDNDVVKFIIEKQAPTSMV